MNIHTSLDEPHVRRLTPSQARVLKLLEGGRQGGGVVVRAAQLAASIDMQAAQFFKALQDLERLGVIKKVSRGNKAMPGIYALGESGVADALDLKARWEAKARDEKAPPRVRSSSNHGQTRHDHYVADPRMVRALRADHPALVQERTLFTNSVTSGWDSERILVSGHNNPKLGAQIVKGEWAGMPLFHVTLEERATCPRSCLNWSTCYGNAMHLARRHDPHAGGEHDPAFLTLLEAELLLLARQHKGGFVVRLHTLGDFYSVDYVRFWASMLDRLPELRVFGYTACLPDAQDPREAAIGQAIAAMTEAAWPYFAIRFSRAEATPQSAVVLDADAPDVLMCPAQSGASHSCTTCGLCWSAATRDRAIGFLRHGMTSRRSNAKDLQ